MEKLPKIYVVLEEFHDYGLRACEPVAWFFDEDEAYKWSEAQKSKGDCTSYRVEGVEAGGTTDD